MMKRYFMIFSAAVAALVSCHKEPMQEPTQEPQVEQSHEVTIEAGILSKTVLQGDAVMWEGSDEIALVFTHTSSDPHVNKTFVNQEAEQTTARAIFKGQLPDDVSQENGYNDLGYAVYPKTAITDKGVFSHNLPATQVAKVNGSFPSGCNLSSAALALSEMGEGGSTKTDFRNALSVLRIALTSDVESVTVKGTAPLAGTAPLQMYYNSADEKDVDNGRLLVDAKGTWSDASTSVTLTPADGIAFENKTYNILVWPGKQEGLTITLNFKNLGEYEKASSISTSKPATFKPAKFYNLNVKNTEELVVKEITGRLDELEDNIPEVDDLEQTVQGLVNQIQSISLVTEFLDNAVYARYAQMTYSKQKIDLSLDYIVKPEAAAEALVEAFNQNPAVVSGLLGYGKGAGLELTSTPLAVKGLTINNLPGIGKVVTATIDASSIDNKFYDGDLGASVALQVVSGETDVMSDFANLIAKAGSVITGNNYISAVPGARVEIPFSYAVSSENYTLAITDSEGVAGASLNYNDSFKTGNLSVSFADGAVGSPSVTLTLTVGEGENLEVVEYDYTFVDNGGRITYTTSGDVDWIGGDVVVEVESTLGSGTLMQTGGTSVTFDNVKVFTFDENGGGQRTANVQFSVMANSLTYYKDITLVQKAYNTPLTKTYYYNGQKVVLNQANASGCSNYFNIVILGDGYKKKDLAVGGKFERSARSAMDSFFAIEPYKTFMNRFNVYMVAYESTDEGTDIKSSSIEKNTYFGSYCQGGGNTAAYVADTAPVINAVKAAAGSGDAQYYRSIAILLVNTDENAGSTGYPFRDSKSGFVNGYASFAIAVLAANSTGTNGLVKHEAGGHAFGRLADEYYTNGTTATTSSKSDLSNWHAKGWYWNVNPNNTSNYYKFTNSAYTSSEVGYIEGAWGYNYGMYRPTSGGMMQGSTGVFNAPSRHAIYHRIITETEGQNAYSWSKFLSYDQKNR